jgi:N6-adenosine-specific RNA methylase IME4
LGFVVSLNLKRRHLSESQRAAVAAKVANMPRGGATYRTANLQTDTQPVSQADAARMLNVSERSVATAAKVIRDGAPELVEAVERGQVSVSAAADVATLPEPEQREIVARGEREILEAAKAIRAQKAVVRREERLDKLAEIAKGNTELATDRRYPIIYADPPWRYENPPIGASSRSIENHYPTMTLDEICALPVAGLATDDALLYLWATAPKLAECMKVIEAWGFEYRTNLVWDKEVIGMGYHARNQHEILLVAKRGEIPPPEAGTQPSSVYREKRGEHSAKPVFYHEMIEAAYPQLPKIELFCRSPREGWAVWGNQSGASDAA